MHSSPLDAYRDVERNTLSGRDLEVMALSKAAMVLQDARSNWESDGHEQRLDDALRYNQRLWTFFQVELSMDENPLPADVRANLLNLSVFVDKRTFETMADPAPEKLDILIAINKNIAAGLRGSPAVAEAAGAAP